MVISPRKIVIKRSLTPGRWAVHAPVGMMFAPDDSINRWFPVSARTFPSFELARQYVADGRAQRSLEPAP